MIQLTGSAPSVSNLASYSGVLTVTKRCGAELTFGVAKDASCAGWPSELAIGVAVADAPGEAVALEFWF